MVADAGDDEVDEIGDALRLMIEAWHGWHNRGAGLADASHVLKLDDAQRRFARHKDQRSTFFQMHIGSSMDQIRRCPGCDC